MNVPGSADFSLRKSMFDYVWFLRDVTRDDSWHETVDGRLMNARQEEARFAADNGQIAFSLNGKAIYVGPIESDYPGYA